MKSILIVCIIFWTSLSAIAQKQCAVPYKYIGNQITVGCRIGSYVIDDFVFDTGCTGISLLPEDLANLKSLGIIDDSQKLYDCQIKAIHGNASMGECYRVPSIRIGNMIVKNVEICFYTSDDVKPRRRLLGQGLFRRFKSVTIDYSSEQILFGF